MKAIQGIVALVGGVCVAIALVAAGFTAAASPPATAFFSGKFCNSATSPYGHDQLVELAEKTRMFTVNPYGNGGRQAAEQQLAQTCMEQALAASNTKEKQEYWQDEPLQIVQAGIHSSSVRAMYALADIDTAYALDEDAVAHLVDCNTLIGRARPWLAGSCAVALAAWVILVAIGARRTLGHMLSWPAAILLALFLAAGIWAFVDFDGLFAAFHALLFPQGNWTFDARSLLISMYPQDFWVALGALWLAVTVLAAIIFIAIGLRYQRAPGKHAR